MFSASITVPGTVGTLGTPISMAGFQYNQSVNSQLQSTASVGDAVQFYGGNISNAASVTQLTPLVMLGIPAPGESGQQPSMSFGATFLYLYAVRTSVGTPGALMATVVGQETAGTAGGSSNPNAILQGGNSFGAPVTIGALDGQPTVVGGLSAATATTITTGTTGVLTLDSGTTGAVNVGTGANAKTVSVGTGAAAKTVNVGSNNTTSTTTVLAGSGGLGLGVAAPGTSGVAIDTPAAGTIAIGAANATILTAATGATTFLAAGAGGVAIGNGGGVSISAGLPNPSTAANTFKVTVVAAGTVDLSGGATDHTTTLGSTTGTSDTTVQAGSGTLQLTATGAGVIAMSMGSGTSNWSVAATGSLQIGSNATDHSVIIGSVTGVSNMTIQCGTGSIALNTTGAGVINMAMGTGTSAWTIGAAGTLTIGGDPNAHTINIGTGAAAQTVTVGSSNGASVTTIACGTGGANFGTSANVHTTTVGGTTGASITILQAGTGALNIIRNGVTWTWPSALGAAGSKLTDAAGNGVLSFT